MILKIIICDDCERGKDDDVLVSSYRVDHGREMCPSGNGYNTNWDYIDLCKECYFKAKLKYGDKIQDDRPYRGL